MLKEIKIFALSYGLVFVAVGFGMLVAEALFGWNPGNLDIVIRTILIVLGFIGLGASASL